VRPEANTQYRVRHDGGPELGVTSGPRRVYVSADIEFHVSDRTVRRGATVLFYGNVSPDHDGDRVELQRRVNGAWKTWKSERLSQRSTFAFKWVPRSGRDVVWQVAKSSDSDHTYGSSRNIQVTVR
jgi:hypothetical protein